MEYRRSSHFVYFLKCIVALKYYYFPRTLGYFFIKFSDYYFFLMILSNLKLKLYLVISNCVVILYQLIVVLSRFFFRIRWERF